MKNETNNRMTRRSFIKRCTVATIALTNMMMFSGIVNAHADSSSPLVIEDDVQVCTLKKQDVFDQNGEYKHTKCWVENYTGACKDEIMPCKLSVDDPTEPMTVWCYGSREEKYHTLCKRNLNV